MEVFFKKVFIISQVTDSKLVIYNPIQWK